MPIAFAGGARHPYLCVPNIPPFEWFVAITSAARTARCTFVFQSHQGRRAKQMFWPAARPLRTVTNCSYYVGNGFIADASRALWTDFPRSLFKPVPPQITGHAQRLVSRLCRIPSKL